MRFLVLLLLVLVATVLFANQFVGKAGFVIIAVGEHAFRLSFVFFVLLSVAAFASMYVALRLLRRSFLAPKTFTRWRATRQATRAERALYHGFTALAEGKWQRAEQLLTEGARISEQPMLYYLGAARAAQGSMMDQRSEVYLSLAEEADADARIAVGLARSEMLLSRAEIGAAQQVLGELRKQAPDHAEILRLQLTLCIDAEAWEQLIELLPALRKTKAVPQDRAEELERAAYAGLLQQVREGHAHPDPVGLWQRVPKRLRDDPELITAHVRNLIAAERYSDAETFLRKRLKHEWHPDLFGVYAEIPLNDARVQLKQGEHWLDEHGRTAPIVKALGQLCRRGALWGKARSYLEHGIELAPDPGSYRLLAEVLLELGESEAAARCHRDGLILATGSGALLPAPNPTLES